MKNPPAKSSVKKRLLSFDNDLQKCYHNGYIREEAFQLARKDVDMTQGHILKHYISFAAPLAVGLLFQQLYNTVDAAVIGNFGSENALAAVTSTGSIVNMLIGVFNGLSMGAGVVLSHAYGSHDKERIQKVVHTTMTATFILCIIATIVGLLVSAPALALMNTDPTVRDRSLTYLTTYFAGISGLLIYNMGSAILRAVGDSKRPLYFLIFSALLNTLLDLVFVIWCGWDVFGVALATIIAQGVSAALILWVLAKEPQAYGLRWKQLHIDKDEFKRIFRIGFPSSVQQGLTSFSNVLVMSYVYAFGAECASGWGAYNKLDAFIMVPVMAIAQASTTFVGQNWGAKQPGRAKQGVRYGLLMSFGCVIALAAAMILFAKPLVSLITNNALEIDFGVRFIYIITPFYITICFNQLYAGALRGIGEAKIPMLIMLGSFVAFRQLYLGCTNLLIRFGVVAELGDVHFFLMSLAFPMGWMMASALLTICYRRSKLFRAEASVAA